jgi:hypothetical protein
VKRDHYETVTNKESFALLIPTSPSEAMGEATFMGEIGAPQPVRPVTLQVLKKTAREMKGAAAAHFGALLALRDALEACDKLALAKAYERMERVYRLRETESAPSMNPESDRKVGEIFSPYVGLSPEETRRYMDGLRLGPRAKDNPQMLLSYEVSKCVNGLMDGQIVLWWVNGAFRPAIYCSDVKTALYIHTFFIAPTGGPGFRICPYDGEQFFQDRPNQDYCCPAHREAHRVARWRAGQKQKAAKQKEQAKDSRRKHGTQKAR